MKTKQPKVFLVNHTPAPMNNIALAVSAWHSDNFFEDIHDIDDVTAQDFTFKALKAYHKTALEYVNLTFVLKNVSRAFQQQLTRTRMASYSIQSLRVVTKGAWATEGRYTMPPSLTDQQKRAFHDNMLIIEDMYLRLLEDGVSAEDARGILPLNIHSDISMNISLAALYHMLRQRFCVLTQWEYRQVATQMRQLVRNRLGAELVSPMEAPCVSIRKCPMRDEYCGIPIWKLDDNERTEQYLNWLPNKEVK